VGRAILLDESPKYLVATKKYSEAVQCLAKVARWNRERFQPEADCPTLNRLRISEGPGDLSGRPIKCSLNICHPFKAYASVIKYDWSLAVCLFCAWLFQGLANWGLTLFLPEYLTSKGAISANLTIFLMVACEVPALLIAFCLVDIRVIGRLHLMRSLFLLSSGASFAAAFIDQKYLIVVLCCAIYFFMIPNWGILYTYSSEVYPTHIRSTANGFFQLHSFVGGSFSPFLSSSLIDQFSASQTVDYYMLAWASCLAFGFIFSCLLRKETVNVSI